MPPEAAIWPPRTNVDTAPPASAREKPPATRDRPERPTRWKAASLGRPVGRSMGRVQPRAAGSIRVPIGKDDKQRSQANLDVEPERPVLDVPEIVGSPLFDGRVPAQTV